MSNRRRINKFCRDNGIAVVKLKYDRRMTYVYGAGQDDSAWTGNFRIHGVDVYDEGYDSDDMIEHLQGWLDDETFVELGKARGIIKNLVDWLTWPDVDNVFREHEMSGWDKPEVSKRAKEIWDEARTFIGEETK